MTIRAINQRTVSALVDAARVAYWDLQTESRASDAIYGDLAAKFAKYRLSADVSESAVDWFEGGTIVESLEYALTHKETS